MNANVTAGFTASNVNFEFIGCSLSPKQPENLKICVKVYVKISQLIIALEFWHSKLCAMSNDLLYYTRNTICFIIEMFSKAVYYLNLV